MMSDLPPDLVEEILSKVPATSLKRLRYTCKRWNSLFKDQRFIEKHLREAPKQVHVLMFNESRVCEVNLNQNVGSQCKGDLDLKDSHSNSEEVDIVEVFHCDGLLLCTTKDYKLVVWNPCLGETWWIQPKTGYHNTRHSRLSLGYENNKSCRSYKILMWLDCREDNQKDMVEIYGISSSIWRVWNDTVPDCCILQTAVSLKGNTFWLAKRREETYISVLSFDFRTERFKHLSLPAFQNLGITADLSVVREENLLVSHRCLNLNQMEIWVTKKFDTQAALSWTKYITVDLLKINRNLFPLMATAVINEEKKVVVGWRRTNMVYITGEEQSMVSIYFQLCAKYGSHLAR